LCYDGKRIVKISNKTIRCYDKRRIVRRINFIWITKHKRAIVDSGIPIQMEIPNLVRTQEFKSHGKIMQG
jgi:hypothetical protein